jgi:hypothetical protein
VLSQATPGSGSQRNLERAGLRTAYTQAIWVDQPEPSICACRNARLPNGSSADE